MTICCISRKKLFTITICKKLLWTTICKSCLEGQFSKQDLSRKLMWSLLCLCGLVLRYFQWMIHGYMEKWHWIIHWFDFVRKHGHAREYATQLESTSESAIYSPQFSLGNNLFHFYENCPLWKWKDWTMNSKQTFPSSLLRTSKKRETEKQRLWLWHWDWHILGRPHLNYNQ